MPARRTLLKAAIGLSVAAGAQALLLPGAAASAAPGQAATDAFGLPLDHGYYDETFRPQYHFTAEKNMINDPNGLVYYDGEYHLSYQYNYFDAIHWGHAVSTDLVHWTHLPPALYPDSIGQVWSGTSAVDWSNTSGLQTGTDKVLVSAFTYNEHPSGPQSQGLAYSNDRGRTWTMHPDNPVLPNPGKKDFRDPKIFWHAPTNRWVMVLVAGDHVEFYTSPNLTQWTYRSSWGAGEGSHGGTWECPDLFEMTVDGTTTKKWILSVSLNNGSPAGGCGMQYFVGSFDGTTFHNDNPADTVLWQNYGKDYYAAITWNDLPASDGRRLMIGWVDNWQYRFDVPTTPFNGQLSLIRELRLKKFPLGLRLVQNPISEYTRLRGTPASWSKKVLRPVGANLLASTTGDSLEIIAQFKADAATATDFGIKVRTGNGQSTAIGYDRTARRMYVDRTDAGAVPVTNGAPNPDWPGRHSAPLDPVNGTVTLRIYVDRSSVEVFGNNREQISELILPDRSSLGYETYAIGGKVTLTSLTVYPLQRIWPARSTVDISGITGWSTVRGAWADTVLGKEGSSDGDGFLLGNVTAGDLTYTAALTVVGVRDGNPLPIKQEAAAGLVFRANDTVSQGYVANIDARGNSVRLFKFNGDGTATTLGMHSTPIDTNTAYRLKVTARGSALTVYLNDTQVIQATDTSFAAGNCGLNTWNSVARFDHISFTGSA
jgi:fructan beta-fructosidase